MFFENLYNFRKQQGYSQEQLAERLGVSRQTIYNWESGTSYPDVEKLMELSNLMGCTLDELMRERIDFVARKQSNVHPALREEANRIYRLFALGVSMGLFLIFTDVSLFLLLYFRGETGTGAFPFTVLSLPIVAAVLMIIYTSLQYHDFRESKKELTLYSEADRQTFYRRYTLFLTIGIGFILFGAVFAIIYYKSITQKSMWPLSLTLILVGLGISIITYYGIQLSKFSEWGERKPSKVDRQYEKMTSIIMLTATLIFLLCGIIWDLWHIAWIVYIVAGILSQIVYTIMQKD